MYLRNANEPLDQNLHRRSSSRGGALDLVNGLCPRGQHVQGVSIQRLPRVLARLRQPETKLRGYTMKQGRPRATGIFETNEELVTAALERHNSGKSMRLIAQILKVSHTTIEKIIKENR